MQKNSSIVVLASEVRREIFLLGLTAFSFVVPFSLGNSQLATGIFVNAALFSSALIQPRKSFLPIILLPSLAVFSRGLIFGPFTSLLLFMMPFIWIGNYLLVIGFQKAYLFSNNGFFSIGASSLIKFLFLFSSANLLFRLGLVPQLFLTTMGIYQLITALAGGFISLLILQKICHGKL